MTTWSDDSGPDSAAPPAEEHVVVFRLAREFFALDIQAVQEIVRMQTITAIPGSEDWVEGITNLRGRVVPVVDLRRRCQLPADDYTNETRIVVVASAAGMVGLIVDAVTGVMRIPADQIQLPGDIVTVTEHAYLRGIAKLEDRLVSVMDLDGVIPGQSSRGEHQIEAAAA